MSLPHHLQRTTSRELDRATDLEREAMMLVERVNRRIQELRFQRSAAAGLRSPPSGSEEGGMNPPVVEPPPQTAVG